MSDQLEATDLELAAEPVRRSPGMPRLILLAIVVAMLVVAVTVGISRTGGSGASGSRAGALPPRPSTSSQPVINAGVAPRLGAIRALLKRRSAAVLNHDQGAFLATVDPGEPAFYRAQSAMFTNLATVQFSGWSYRLGSTPAGHDAAVLARYDVPAWAPARIDLHYQIAGFDRASTDLPQYPTFVDRAGRWYLASLSDFRHRGEVSATDLWDYAPVQEVRRGPVLVLGPVEQRATMVAVADRMRMAVPEVTAVWGPQWARRVIVQVPSSQHEMGLIAGDDGGLRQIAALTSSEVSTTRGRPAPVGDRITINPRIWPTLGSVGAAVVLTHELTHVATRADTGSQTPKWLAEGFADYVGFRGEPVSVPSAAAELARAVRAGRLPDRLPSNADFAASAPRLAQAYELSWLACRYIARHYGQRTLVRFYRAVGRSRETTSRAVTVALHRVLGLRPSGFTVRWRTYVHAELDS